MPPGDVVNLSILLLSSLPNYLSYQLTFRSILITKKKLADLPKFQILSQSVRAHSPAVQMKLTEPLN